MLGNNVDGSSLFEDLNDFIPSGIPSLDDEIGGFRNGGLYTVAGGPGMGKTTLILSILHSVGIKSNIPVALFTYEMKEADVAKRLLAIESRIPYVRILKDDLQEVERHSIHLKSPFLSGAKITIDTTARLKIDELAEKSRKLKDEGVKLIVIDDIQRIPIDEPSRKFAANREQEISANVRELKTLARELDLPIIIISQLNRSLETRGGDKRPLLVDLRDSGAIENDTDVVIFLYRAEQYGFLQDEDGNSNVGVAELLIEKNRFGATSMVRLHFNKDIPLFESYTKTESSNSDYTIPSKINGLNSLEIDEDESPF